MRDFQTVLQEETAYAEQVVLQYLPVEEGFQKTVLEAMNYSVRAGGKRLRPLLIHSCYRLFHGQTSLCEPFMAAMEYIHTYSLIHDDLPAMDNDDYRRGKPTCHKAYGEDMAILAGDALLNYAYETAFTAFETHACDGSAIAAALHVLARKAGIFGMVGGQTVDVENDGKPLNAAQLNMIYENKTGALLEASMMIGAALAKADREELVLMESIASDIGIAFQIQDDILDVIGDRDLLGKPIGSDDKNSKITYVSLFGIEDSMQKVQELTERADRKLDSLKNADPEAAAFLRELFAWLVHRKK